MLEIFQSTPPARGATRLLSRKVGSTYISIHAPREGGDKARQLINIIYPDFNPRPPRGGRPPGVHGKNLVRLISIHAPREGGDINIDLFSHGKQLFQSTPPARGATDRPEKGG